MNRPAHNRSSSSKASSMAINGLRSGLLSASKQIKGTYQNVAQSVNTVRDDRATTGPKGSFIGQIKAQITHDRSKRREDEERGTQRLALFPGWAVRRFEAGDRTTGDVLNFRIDVFVSGYAYMVRPPDKATRSQKAFLSIAKAFASLPKIPQSAGMYREDTLGLGIPLSRSTEDLLKMANLPPRPDEMTPDREAEVLKHHGMMSEPLEPPRPSFLADTGKLPPADVSRRERDKQRDSMYSQRNSSSASVSSQSSASSQSSTQSFVGLDPAEVIRLHENFRSRLQPFWAQMVKTGTVRLSIYTTNIHTGAVDRNLPPLATAEVAITSDTGYFGKLFTVPFETVCQHPGGVQIAFGDHNAESRLTVVAEYLAPPPLPPRPGALAPPMDPHAPSIQSQLHALPPPTAQNDFAISDARVRLISDIDDTIKVSNILHGIRAVFRNVFVKSLEELACPGMPEWYQSMSDQGVKFHYVSNSPFELLPVLSEFLRIVGFPMGSLKLKYYGGKSLFKGLWEPAGERKRAGVIEILDYFPDAKFLLVGDSGEQDMELYTALAKEFHRAGRRQILGVFIRDVNPEPIRSSTLGLPASSSTFAASPISSRASSPIRASFSSNPRDSINLDSGTFLGVSATSNVAPAAVYPTTASPFADDLMSFDDSQNQHQNPFDEPQVTNTLDHDRTIKAPPPPPPLSHSSMSSRSIPPSLPPRPSRTSSLGPTPIPAPLPPSVVNRDPHPPPRHQGSSDSALSDTAIAAALASANTSPPSLTKKRAEFKLRLARAREGMPPDVPLVIFVHPEECYDVADKLLGGLGIGASTR